ncbi:MAG: hypothetical protein ACYDCC_06805 [Actinomycetota bacterium]
MTELLEGSVAIAEAAIAAGCRFYAGYPITPSTEILERMAKRMPEVGGVCMNAESEIEGIGMVWGAAATGARAMIASTGQGISLMQESFAEMAYARVPFLAVNMSRGQADYFQSTRGGGHGDYRFFVFAPASVQEAADLTALAFEKSFEYRVPALLLGDFLLGHTSEAVTITQHQSNGAGDWTITGARNRASRNLGPLGSGKTIDLQEAIRGTVGVYPAIQQNETLYEARWCDDAELIVCAFGMASRFVKAAVKQLREKGERIAFFRPITLWPFPSDALRSFDARFAVFEVNAGQMIEDVRLAVGSDAAFIGGVSTDRAGFGVGDLFDVNAIRERIESVWRK